MEPVFYGHVKRRLLVRARTNAGFLYQGKCADKLSLSKRPIPHNKLHDEEVAAVLTVCNQAAHASLPPSQIVPRLADEGIYLASESTFYRLLKANRQLHHRGRAKQAQKRKAPTTHIATAPRQLWSWDITYLASPVKGKFYFTDTLGAGVQKALNRTWQLGMVMNLPIGV